MCHEISWYHVICLHAAPASSIRISCKAALQSGYDCCTLESWALPIVGVCPWCTVKAANIDITLQPKSQTYPPSPMQEEFEDDDDDSFEHDESYFSDTDGENSIDDMELFDRITF